MVRPANENGKRVEAENAPQPVVPNLPAALPRSWPLPLIVVLAMRPRQWSKNLLCVAAVVMANKLRDTGADWRTAACVALFCALSGVVYLINDILDVDRDRMHPRKRLRPIASGRLPIPAAKAAAAVVLVVSMALCFLLGFSFFEAALAYIVLQFGYVFYFKHEVLLDVFAIALGYVLRAAAGALAIKVDISVWLYLCTILGGLFLALGKRRQELIELEGLAAAHRRNLGEYSIELVDQLIGIVAASTIVAYSLYTFTAPNLPSNHSMMVTVPFAIYGIFRYLYLMHQRKLGASPEEVLLHDRPLQVCILLWGAIAIAVVSTAGHVA